LCKHSAHIQGLANSVHAKPGEICSNGKAHGIEGPIRSKQIVKRHIENIRQQFYTQNISGITDALNIAVLTGFLLCDEINKMKHHMEGESLEVEKRTMNLIAKLNEVLEKVPNDD
jgi:hypothetical protein